MLELVSKYRTDCNVTVTCSSPRFSLQSRLVTQGINVLLFNDLLSENEARAFLTHLPRPIEQEVREGAGARPGARPAAGDAAAGAAAATVFAPAALSVEGFLELPVSEMRSLPEREAAAPSDAIATTTTTATVINWLHGLSGGHPMQLAELFRAAWAARGSEERMMEAVERSSELQVIRVTTGVRDHLKSLPGDRDSVVSNDACVDDALSGYYKSLAGRPEASRLFITQKNASSFEARSGPGASRRLAGLQRGDKRSQVREGEEDGKALLNSASNPSVRGFFVEAAVLGCIAVPSASASALNQIDFEQVSFFEGDRADRQLASHALHPQPCSTSRWWTPW
jgi:hypothetical protein